MEDYWVRQVYCVHHSTGPQDVLLARTDSSKEWGTVGHGTTVPMAAHYTASQKPSCQLWSHSLSPFRVGANIFRWSHFPPVYTVLLIRTET